MIAPNFIRNEIATPVVKTTTRVAGDAIKTTTNIGIRSADIFLEQFAKEKERYEKRKSSNKSQHNSTKPCLQSQRLINMNRY
jgi:hypothetical protein